MDVFVEILNGIGRLLLQPALYVGILLAILAGFNRVRWERKSFSISIYSPWLELKSFFGVSLLFGLAISVVTSLIGFGVMIEWVAIFNVVACFLLNCRDVPFEFNGIYYRYYEFDFLFLLLF